ETGKYRFQVFDGLECEVMIYKDGFKPAVLNISSKTAHKETYQINLSKVPNMVTGLLFDSRNNQPLNEVHITAQAKDMAPLKTTSNTNGSYQLALTPNTKYIIRYSKAGYLDTHQKIQTGEKVSANLLEPILLIPASTNIEDDTEMVAATPPPKEKEEIKPTPTDTTMDIAAMDTSDSEESSPTETTKTEQAPATTKGYAVQVAALNMKDKVQKDNFAALAAVGNLYTRPQKGMKKVRVGIYHTKEEALQARKNIVAKGFKSAFVVAEEIADPDEIQVILTAPTLQPAAAKAEDKQPKDFPTEKTETESSSIDAIPSIFMVRLATYSRPELFDASKIETLGKLEKRLKGNMTIMLLSGFPTLKAAREASKAAAAKGFKGAHVVIEEDGKLIKL
ncbi:MAG TPA: hypothetical protein ENJ45_05480, partial [Phaeodactylibacter sp.]|nr:hypothetical protein [Phaeodactylibacter sp.]